MMDFFSAGYAVPPFRASGDKVVIRPAEMEDFAAWSALREKSHDFLEPWEPTWPHDYLSRSSWQRRIKRQYEDWRQDNAYSCLVFRLEDGVLVGGLSLNTVRRGVSQSAQLGYWAGFPFVRRGYISEAVRLLLDYGFHGLELHRIEAGCLPRNIASQNLLKKVGFQPEGLARAYLKINGAWEDHLMFSMLKEEWVNGAG